MMGTAKDADHCDDWIDLLVANPALIQRPLVVADDGTAYVARDPDAVDLAIKHSGGTASRTKSAE
jgi:arsenate reductase